MISLQGCNFQTGGLAYDNITTGLSANKDLIFSVIGKDIAEFEIEMNRIR